MTISTEPVPVSYNGDDATVAFSVPFKYFAKSDVRVTHRSSAGVETTWALDTDYTLTAAGDDAGGTLTATTAPATGAKITIDLDTPNTQTASFPKGGDFPSTAAENALDRLTQIVAKIEQLFNRALRVPITDTQIGSLLQLPIDSSRASQFLAFDADGAPIAAAGTSADLGPVTPFVNTLLDDADADAVIQTLATSATAETAPATDDALLFSDTSAADGRKMTFANFLKVVNALTEDTAPDAALDFLLSYDASASAVKKVSPHSLRLQNNDISPTQITANQNDYSPTGLSTASVLRLSTDALRDVTGLAGGSDGREITILNVGAQLLALKDESASSTAANRFALPNDVILSADESAVLWYDATSSRWRLKSYADIEKRTWQDKTGSRAITSANVYQNLTGKTIQVSISALSAATYQASLMVGTANPPTIIGHRQSEAAAAIIINHGPVDVPHGHYYSLFIDSGTNPTLEKWSELTP